FFKQPALTGGFELQTVSVQQRLSVTTGLLFTFEDQVRRGLERNAIKGRSHVDVQRVTGVLLVNDSGHALQAVFNLFAGTNTVLQPVGNVLRRNTQSRAVFHQADVVDVRYFRATNALVNPAHHITQNTLTVVVQFFLNLFSSQ